MTNPGDASSDRRRRVLITGADGRIGRVLRSGLADRYELRSLTHKPAPFDSFVGDVTDLESIRPAFDGVDAVVHLAGNPSVRATWDAVLPANIVGTRNVYEAAATAGVPLVIYASSNHAIGMYEVDGAPGIHQPGHGRSYDEHAEVRPDSLYGVTKLFGEAIGRYFVERRGLRVIALRIGSVSEDDDPATPMTVEAAPEKPLTEDQQVARHAAVWLSHRDCVSLVSAAIDADAVRWVIAYGVSDNVARFWSLESARRLLGWWPDDGADVQGRRVGARPPT
jgi:nucleoside-diphosphate-sugar epimerase